MEHQFCIVQVLPDLRKYHQRISANVSATTGRNQQLAQSPIYTIMDYSFLQHSGIIEVVETSMDRSWHLGGYTLFTCRL